MAASGAASSGRKYQLVLWGATGFTGKLVAEYLAQHAPSNFRWAIAGRSKDRLEAVLRSLPPSSADIVLADLENVPSLVAMTSSTEVLLSTAGPFFKLGLPIAQACVETATHYLDSTGEIHYEKRLLDFHERLQRAGVLFVPMCGFDCVPFDLGALLIVQHAREKLGVGIVGIKSILADFKGGISGGTLASMALAVESVPMGELQNTLALVPPSALGLHKRTQWSKYPWPVWSADFGAWTVPSLMASVNESITRRSASLSSPVWGKSFSYAERSKSGNLFFAILFSTAFFVGMLALYFRLSRGLLMRFLPKPGEGPSRKVIESGHFTVQMIGETEDGRRVQATVRGIRDPGYGETAKMLAESAMCMALDRARIPGKGGVLTSATAFGMTFETK